MQMKVEPKMRLYLFFMSNSGQEWKRGVDLNSTGLQGKGETKEEYAHKRAYRKALPILATSR